MTMANSTVAWPCAPSIRPPQKDMSRGASYAPRTDGRRTIAPAHGCSAGSADNSAMGRRTNLALLATLAAALATGWLAFAYATAPARWSLLVHATSGFANLVLIPWKSVVVRR